MNVFKWSNCTWQPNAARRKVRTGAEMGAAPVNIMRTCPPMLAYRGQHRPITTLNTTALSNFVSTEDTGSTFSGQISPGLSWRWSYPTHCLSSWSRSSSRSLSSWTQTPGCVSSGDCWPVRRSTRGFHYITTTLQHLTRKNTTRGKTWMRW